MKLLFNRRRIHPSSNRKLPIDITEEEVLKKIMKLNPSKPLGPDCLRPRMLKETADVIAKPLTIIFNKSLKEGMLPKDWKVANVSAIFKKGKLTSPGNYPPVSLMSVVCKLLESIIRDHIMKYLDERELLSEDQHGFRAGHSCITQLMEIVEVWTGMLDEGEELMLCIRISRRPSTTYPTEGC